MIVIGTMAICNLPVNANELTDDLNNWMITAGHTDVLTLDSGNDVNFRGDTARVKCNMAGSGSFYYHVPNVQSFSGTAFYFQQQPGSIEVYGSSDTTQWSLIPLSFSPAQMTFDGWYSSVFTPAARIPDGTNYILYLLKAGPQVFTPQIGRLSLKFGDSTGNGPKGLSVMSVAGQSCLSWFPVSTATSYSVKRCVDGALPETIAVNLKTTTYVDRTTKPGSHVTYAVTANSPTGVSEDSDYQTQRGSVTGVLMTDPLNDWSLSIDHSSGLAIGEVLTGVRTIRRTAAGKQNVTYNMPGLVNFAANVYSSGRSFGDGSEVTAEVSVDGVQWTVVPLKFSDVDTISPQWAVEGCLPKDPIPAGNNYLRLSIADLSNGGSSTVDSTQIGQLRLIYGATAPSVKLHH